MSHRSTRSKLMSSCFCSSVPGALNYWGLHQTLHINSHLLSFATSCLACQVSSCLFHLSMHVNPFQHLIPISSDISRPHRSHCERAAEVFILRCVMITSCHMFDCIISLHSVNMRENRFYAKHWFLFASVSLVPRIASSYLYVVWILFTTLYSK